MKDSDLLIELIDFLNFIGQHTDFIEFMTEKGYSEIEVTDKLIKIEIMEN